MSVESLALWRVVVRRVASGEADMRPGACGLVKVKDIYLPPGVVPDQHELITEALGDKAVLFNDISVDRMPTGAEVVYATFTTVDGLLEFCGAANTAVHLKGNVTDKEWYPISEDFGLRLKAVMHAESSRHCIVHDVDYGMACRKCEMPMREIAMRGEMYNSPQKQYKTPPPTPPVPDCPEPDYPQSPEFATVAACVAAVVVFAFAWWLGCF